MDEITQCPNSDISTLPQNIIEEILSLMPIRDALRTSVLSKTWQYCWQSMPKLTFTNDMIKLPCESNKYKLVSAIFHVLLLHNGPEILEFDCSVGSYHMESEFSQIISYLARENKVKELIFISDDGSYKLPLSFFLLQGLKSLDLRNCTFEPPLTFNRFSCLKSMYFEDVEVSAQKLQRFLSKCPLLDVFSLEGCQDNDFAAEGNKFTFVDLLQCVPLIQSLQSSMYYMKYLSVDSMPRKLPTSLAHLYELFLDVCLMEQNEISSVLCMVRSSPVLEHIVMLMYDNDKLPVRQTPTNFLDPEGYSDLKLDHLEILEILEFSNLHLEMEFVKLIMAKSPVLKKIWIVLNDNVSINEEQKMLRELELNPISQASPSAKLSIVRSETYNEGCYFDDAS